MARTIDLDKAIEIIEEKQKELCPVGRYGRNYVYVSDREKYDAWEEIIDALENLPTITPPNEPPPCYTEEKRNTAYLLCAGRGFANCAHCALWSDFEEDQDETRINRPLTLEELREMSYTDWVWAVFPELPSEENEWVRASQLYRRYSHEHYGKTWIAYRRPPEVSP